jgi:hypothetical protein
MTIAFLVALKEKPTLFADLAALNEFATPGMSVAALDSLDTMSWKPLDPTRADALSLPVTGTHNGATTAIHVWNRRELRYPIVPYGDTTRVGSDRANTWRTYADRRWIDSLVHAAQEPWIVSGGAIKAMSDSISVFRSTLNVYSVLNTTRAMLARAASQWPKDEARGRFVARSVINIGRALQADAAMIHVAIGLHVERDALAFLARRGSVEAERSLPRAEAGLATALRGLHLIRVAGAVPGHATLLAKAAQDAALPLAARREMLISVGYGWAFNAGQEMNRFVTSRERVAALEALSPEALPPALRPALVASLDAARSSFTRRILIGPDYSTLTAPLREVW